MRRMDRSITVIGRQQTRRRRKRTRSPKSCEIMKSLCVCLIVFVFHGAVVVFGQEPTVPETLSPTSPPLPPTEEPITPPPTEPTAPPSTPSPTEGPAEPPTDNATPRPTTAPPVESPTSVPTRLPTSSAPTDSPSGERTDMPTIIASLKPSASSQSPTITPVPIPLMPSDMPTLELTPLPSQSPAMPSAAPTPLPSATPSAERPLSLQDDLVTVHMWFDDCPELFDRSIINFERVTSQHIQTDMVTVTTPAPIYDLDVGTNIKKQVPGAESVESRQRRLYNLRMLQTTATSSPLLIIFDTAVEFRSASQDHDVPALIGDAFATDEDIEQYVASLQATGDPSFDNISSVRWEINGVEGGGDDDENSGGIDHLWIIVGASAGGAVLFAIAGAMFAWGRCKNKEKKTVAVSAMAPSINGNQVQYSTEIVFDHQDDISTLGDPMYAPGGMLIPGLEKDETVTGASFGDYEYAKTYGGANGAPPSVISTDADGTKRTGLLDGASERESTALDMGQDDIFSDDSSFEEQYQDGQNSFNVMAPAGKLGMVIDTPSGGTPVVHAIQETSVLASQVRVGDRLLSVDGEDCTCMTAMQVSKLISHKAKNTSRALVFSRPRARMPST